MGRNVFIVHAHPERKSMNGALTAHAREVLRGAGHQVVVSNLYAMRFDPVSDRRNYTGVKDPETFKQQVEELHAARIGGFAPDVKAEMDKLLACDALVLQFPLWWFSMPAILKGWVDRVFAMGVLYGGGKWYDDGPMKGKRAIVSVTTGGPESIYAPDGLNGDIHSILFPVNHGILRFTGFDVLPPFIVWAPARAGAGARQGALAAWGDRLGALFTTDPIRYPALSEYGPDFRRKA
jgi:NAD(P)H dehydrogenase (quinone)